MYCMETLQAAGRRCIVACNVCASPPPLMFFYIICTGHPWHMAILVRPYEHFGQATPIFESASGHASQSLQARQEITWYSMNSERNCGFLFFILMGFYIYHVINTLSGGSTEYFARRRRFFLSILPAGCKIVWEFCPQQAKSFEYVARRRRFFDYFARCRRNLLSILLAASEIFWVFCPPQAKFFEYITHVIHDNQYHV